MGMMRLLEFILEPRPVRKIWRLLNSACFLIEDKLTMYHNIMKTDLLKSRLKEVGKNVMISHPCYISKPENVRIMDNVYLGSDAVISSEGGLTIGKNCAISSELLLYTWNHRFKETLPLDKISILKPVNIGENVWIGRRVSIIPGINIGEGAVIGMGSVVVKDVLPLTIVGGNPAKVIGFRDKKLYGKLKREKKFIFDSFNEDSLGFSGYYKNKI